MESDTRIGEQIRRAREMRGWTQQQLSALVRVSRPMISRYESGHDEPSIEILARIAVSLGTTISIDGYRLVFSSDGDIEPDRVEQLCFDYDKETVFEAAIVKIRPTRGKLSITAILVA